LEKSEAIIFVTNHKEFDELNGGMLNKNDIKVIIDGLNSLDKDDIENNGVIYKGIGR